MSDKIELNAEPRSDMGKGASRRLRKTGMVPAIIYGGGDDPESITLAHNEFIHELEKEAIYSQVLSVKLGKKKEDVILRDLQRHPYKNLVMHADFQRIDKNKAISVTVPLHFINEETCHGVKMEGGLLNHLVSEVEISCLPKHLPEFLELDVAELKLGESLHLSDISLPEGVEIVALTHGEDHDTGVAAVNKTRESVEEVVEEGEAAAEEGGEEAAEE
ncbi:MAG: 50S ribosomal protein L25/general stress protein Ctc [Gammaproteobacteria bacterium]|nr:50S ribosomal protein L25/general stress protein Ctc [Gammaproteobacteria bacterium]